MGTVYNSSQVNSYDKPRITAFKKDQSVIDFRLPHAGHTSIGLKTTDRISMKTEENLCISAA